MVERAIERLVLASRWLQVPMYLGLAIALIALVTKFFEELVVLSAAVWGAPESSIVLSILMLVDIVLVANLVVMVIIGGYENFVSRFDVDPVREKLPWLGKLAGGTIKIKMATSALECHLAVLLAPPFGLARVRSWGAGTAWFASRRPRPA